MATIDNPLDIHDNVAVGLPLNPAHAGYAQLSYMRSTTAIARLARITAEGELRISHTTLLFESDFNGAAGIGLLNNQFNQQATVLTSLLTGGFLRLNSNAVTTVNAGISINTWQAFQFRDSSNIKASLIMRHVGASGANKLAEFGFGYYDIAATQGAAMNEFVGFRFTDAGGLLAAIDYSVGGAATTISQSLTVPADNATHFYEIVIGEEGADFWIDGTMVASLVPSADEAGILKAGSYPYIARLRNATSSPAVAPVFELGALTINRLGPAFSEYPDVVHVAQGRHSTRAQAGIQAASGNVNAVPASGTAPTALVPSNSVSGLVGLGGYGRHTMTGVVAAVHTELIMCSFLNPAIPETLGAIANPKSLVITDIMISPLIASVLFAGGGFSAEWFLAYGGTALALNTVDAIGTTNPGAKSYTKLPLPIIDTFAAAAAAGTIGVRTGEQGLISLQTPIVVNPGEFIALGLRTLFVAAAVTAGAVDAGYTLNGYWK